MHLGQIYHYNHGFWTMHANLYCSQKISDIQLVSYGAVRKPFYT